MRLIAIIPARGGSKGIPRKNIHPVCGRPLIAYSIEAALRSRSIERTIVSTDDHEIAEISRQFGAEPRMRPAALAQDDTPTRAVLAHVVDELAREFYAPDAVMTLQPTSPARTVRHIDDAAALFASHPSADSLVSCIEVPHIFHPLSVMRRNAEGYLEPFLPAAQPHRRQDKPPLFARNGAAIYITRTTRLAEYVFGGRLLPYPMDEESSVDIDTIEDIARAEHILRARLARAEHSCPAV
jgi:CMP-N,N'-diacetyllegionaminic acid synthase